VSFRSYRYECLGEGGATRAARGAAFLDEDFGALHEARETLRRSEFEAGHAQGLEEGRKSALRAAEVALAERLPAALAQLGDAVAELRSAKRKSEQDALLLVRAILRQLLPKLADRVLSLELATQVADVIASAQTPTIEVRCSERTRDVVRRLCGPLPAGVELMADPAIAEASLACVWADGSAHFNAQAVTDAISAIIERCLNEAQAVEHQRDQA
jgi:flagellar biosynthesis/type III secretory pathway protein FliH